MSNCVERDYAELRMAQELGLGAQSSLPTVAAAHYEMAFLYSLRAYERREQSNVTPFASKRRAPRVGDNDAPQAQPASGNLGL